MNQTEPRILVCAATGQRFAYSGRGRPPKYAPGCKPKQKAAARKALSEMDKLAA